jgi:hypothetical protein
MKSFSRGMASIGMAVVLSGSVLVFAPAPAAALLIDGKQTLKDGTKVEVEGNKMYQWIRGKRTVVKDGTYELKSGQKVTVKDGMITETGKAEFPNIKK